MYSSYDFQVPCIMVASFPLVWATTHAVAVPEQQLGSRRHVRASDTSY